MKTSNSIQAIHGTSWPVQLYPELQMMNLNTETSYIFDYVTISVFSLHAVTSVVHDSVQPYAVVCVSRPLIHVYSQARQSYAYITILYL